MSNRTKRIFISDIHMGDDKSMQKHPNPYCWLISNIDNLADFLQEQIGSKEVREVVILGDLFDQWIVPTVYDPVLSFKDFCSAGANNRVIQNLKTLAVHPDIGLAYVPGNHDMAMDPPGISAVNQFMVQNFPGIRLFCDGKSPCGVYSVGTLAAEHGHRFCLFNAPDDWTNPADFLPLGYFISRVVAFNSLNAATAPNPRKIFFDFLQEFMHRPDFVQDMFLAIAQSAGLSPTAQIKVDGVPGYTNPVTVEDIGKRFRNLISDWEHVPGNPGAPAAIMGDLGNLYYAAANTYFRPGSHVNVAIFGHTHDPVMGKSYFDGDVKSDNAPPPGETPCRTIYANCGAWVDSAEKGCTYVEVEDAPDQSRLYVRVVGYPGKNCIDEAFVETSATW